MDEILLLTKEYQENEWCIQQKIKKNEELKMIIEEKRKEKNKKYVSEAIQDGELKKCSLTLEELHKKIQEEYETEFSLKNFLYEKTEGCMTTIYMKENICSNNNNVAIQDYYDDSHTYFIGFYLLHLKDGFVFYPFPFEPFIGNGINGNYIKNDLYPFLKKTYETVSKKNKIDDLNDFSRYQTDSIEFQKREIKLLILEQAMKPWRLTTLF